MDCVWNYHSSYLFGKSAEKSLISRYCPTNLALSIFPINNFFSSAIFFPSLLSKTFSQPFHKISSIVFSLIFPFLLWLSQYLLTREIASFLLLSSLILCSSGTIFNSHNRPL